MEAVMYGDLLLFISGELKSAALKDNLSKYKETVEQVRLSGNLSKRAGILYKLVQLASEDPELRFEKAFIAKVI